MTILKMQTELHSEIRNVLRESASQTGQESAAWAKWKFQGLMLIWRMQQKKQKPKRVFVEVTVKCVRYCLLTLPDICSVCFFKVWSFCSHPFPCTYETWLTERWGTLLGIGEEAIDTALAVEVSLFERLQWLDLGFCFGKVTASFVDGTICNLYRCNEIEFWSL